MNNVHTKGRAGSRRGRIEMRANETSCMAARTAPARFSQGPAGEARRRGAPVLGGGGVGALGRWSVILLWGSGIRRGGQRRARAQLRSEPGAVRAKETSCMRSMAEQTAARAPARGRRAAPGPRVGRAHAAGSRDRCAHLHEMNAAFVSFSPAFISTHHMNALRRGAACR